MVVAWVAATVITSSYIPIVDGYRKILIVCIRLIFFSLIQKKNRCIWSIRPPLHLTKIMFSAATLPIYIALLSFLLIQIPDPSI